VAPRPVKASQDHGLRLITKVTKITKNTKDNLEKQESNLTSLCDFRDLRDAPGLKTRPTPDRAAGAHLMVTVVGRNFSCAVDKKKIKSL
jgi:hypothetical protein